MDEEYIPYYSVYREENILYKSIDNKYHYCYYSISGGYCEGEDPNDILYQFEFNKGEVGEINDFDCAIEKDINILKRLRDEEIEGYTIKQIPLIKIGLKVNLNDFFSRLSKKKQLILINHVSGGINFICKSSGLGINNFVAPKNKVVLESGIYKTTISVYDRDDFKKLFIEHITPCCVNDEEVTFIDLLQE